MTAHVKHLVALPFIVGVALLTQSAARGDVTINQQTPGSGGSGSCTYCSQDACGCPSCGNHRLNFECACSSIQCTQSCSCA